MDENSEAYRHWRDIMRYSRGERAAREGMEYVLARMREGRMFRRDAVDLAAEMDGFATFGLTSPLQRFWPRLVELVAGNNVLAQRMAELTGRVLLIELDLDGFAAGVRRFPDDSHLVQIDSGLFFTIFEVVQMFVEVAASASDTSPEARERETGVLLELLLAEYRILRRNASPKGRLPAPTQGEFIGELSQAADVYVLAHEVSHVLLGHSAGRDMSTRATDEATADVLAFHILGGYYADAAEITKPQAFGRLLGARLLFSCIELVEHATFVTLGRTHPPAADRWELVRTVSEQMWGPAIAAGVDELWRPMERLIGRATSAETPLPEVVSQLRSITADGRLLGDVDVPSAAQLIHSYRLTNAAVEDPVLRAEGERLAVVIQEERRDDQVISWCDLIDCQKRRHGAWTDDCALAVAHAGRILQAG